MKSQRRLIVSACYSQNIPSYEIRDFRKTISSTKGSSNNEVSRINLSQCFTNFSKQEIVEDFKCEQCNQKGSCFKKIEIHKLPKILIIQLKRFMMKISPYGFKMLKNPVQIDFPYKQPLNLSNIINPKKIITPKNGKQKLKYQLTGVVYHSGDLQSGHYYAKRKAPIYEVQRKGGRQCISQPLLRWHQFNDTRVKQSHEDDIIEPEAYILFYKAI